MRRTVFALAAFLVFACAAAVAGERVTVTLDEINNRGYIPQWMVIGKFSAGLPGGYTGMVVARRAQLPDKDFLEDQGGEAAIKPEVGMAHARGEKGQALWQKLSADSGLIDLGPLYSGMPESTMYAAVYIDSIRDAALFLDMETLTGATVWVNHELALRSAPGALGETGREKLLVQLKSGVNLLLIKFGGLRYERAAETLQQPLPEVVGFVRSVSPVLANGSGLCMSLKAGPMQRVPGTPVYMQTNLQPTGYYHGSARFPAMEFTMTVANSGSDAIENVEVKIQSDKQNGQDAAKLYLPGNTHASLRLALPVPANAPGQTISARITVTAAGMSHTVPTQFTAGAALPKRDQAIYYVTGFHADPVWIEDQRDYSVALIGSARQNVLLAQADPSYGAYLSEISYLKPFFDMYPELREPLKQMIKEGRIGTGGAYNQPVEKLISGEGLARNIVYGKLFHKNVLGADPTVYMGWDIFGHAAQLSQIVLETGGQGAMWSKGIVGFPPIFRHAALDGSTVLHKRSPYSMSSADPDSLRSNLYTGFEEFASYGLDYDVRLDAGDFKPPTAWLAGQGDYLRKLLPKIDINGTGAELFFKNVNLQLLKGEGDIPLTARDMAYYHQGTALSRISLKTGNRLAENALISAEKLATVAALFGATYPDITLDKAWRQLLFGQHHDAITGTINDKSYLDLMQGYREALELAAGVLDKSAAHIGRFIDTQPPSGVPAGAIPIAVFNPLNWSRKDVARAVVEFGDQAPGGFFVADASGAMIPFEIERADRDTNTVTILFLAEKVPEMGYTTYFVVPADQMPEGTVPGKSEDVFIENSFYKLEVDPLKGGGIVSLYDKINGKQVMAPGNGVGNDIAALKENPVRNEPPWEVYTTGDKKFSSEKPALVEKTAGAITERLIIRGAVGDTGKEQEIILYKDLPRIDFITRIVDYRGTDDMFVVTFPVDVANAVPVFEERYGALVRHKSKGKLNFQTWQMRNYSGHGAEAAYQWLDQSHSGLLEFRDDEGQTQASFALGMMGLITDHQSSTRAAADKITLSLIRKGIPSTPWFDDADEKRLAALPRSDSTMPEDMNFDLNFGTSFRISINSGTNNAFTRSVFKELDPALVQQFEADVTEKGFAYLFVLDPTSPDDWPPVPLLILKALDDEALQRAADALAADFDADAVITLGAAVNASGSDQRVEDYGVALLNKGTVFNSIENDGTMAMALMHTASFFRRLPFPFIPEQRTAVFPYALVPHKGNWRDAAMYRTGYEYNNPLIAMQLETHMGDLPRGGMSFLTTRGDTLVLTAMKPRGNPTASLAFTPQTPRENIMLRYYEASGFSQQASVEAFTGIRKALWSNMLEQDDFGRLPVETGTLKLDMGAFDIRTIGYAPQNPPALQLPAALGPVTEPFSPVFNKFWLHNNGAAPMGYLPVSIGLRGDIQTKIHISQGGVSVNEVEVFVNNDYIDRKVEGKVRIVTPPDWRAVPAEFDYVLQPGQTFAKKVAILFLGSGRDGVIKAQTEHGGQILQDILEVGDHKLDLVSARFEDGAVSVTLRNPTAQSIEGELYLITPLETWGAGLVDEFALARVTPRMIGFAVPAGMDRTYSFTLAGAWAADTHPAPWAVIKGAYNGRVFYSEIDNIDNIKAKDLRPSAPRRSFTDPVGPGLK